MEKEKKEIKCSYSLLVIILFATVCFLTDYIVIERKTRVNKCPKCENTCTKCDVKEENSVVKDTNEEANRIGDTDYDSNSTVRHFEYYVKGETDEWYDFVKYSLDLYDDGTFGLYIYNENLPEDFKFMHWKEFFGNYSVSNGYLRLDYLYYITNNGGMYWHAQGTSIFNISADVVTGLLNYSDKNDKSIILSLKKTKLEYSKYNSMNDVLKDFTLAY